MEIIVEGLQIFFPFKKMYVEQQDYISKLVPLFLKSKNALIQLPPAISKSACFFSVYFSWKLQNPNEKLRIVYAADTEYEISHIAGIVKLVYNYIKSQNPNFKALTICLGEKKNLCIENNLARQAPKDIEDGCLEKIAPWNEGPKCGFYSNFLKFEPIPNEGCFSFEDLKTYGSEKLVCPFYLSNSLKYLSDVIICNFFYLNSLSKYPIETEILKNSMLFVDECTGLDDKITQIYTERASKYFLDRCVRSIEFLHNEFKGFSSNEIEKARLEADYDKLKNGLTQRDLSLKLGKPPSSDLEIEEPKVIFPGYIRRHEHFIIHVKKFIVFLKSKYFTGNPKQRTESIEKFLENYAQDTLTHPEAVILSYFSDRLLALFNSLKISKRQDHKVLEDLCRFASLAMGSGSLRGNYDFVYEFPKTQEKDESSSKILSLVCLGPDIPFADLSKNFKNVIMNSELLQDVEILCKILNFGSVQTSVAPPKKIPIFPVLVSKGADLIEISNELNKKEDGGVLRNYSNLLTHLSEFVPDGILCLFPNESYIKNVGLKEYKEILDHKLVFAETKDWNESLKNYVSYQKACENGRGGVFLGLINGKIMETINFSADLTKCIIVFGMPVDAKPREYIRRLKHLAVQTGESEKDLVIYDSMKRVLKSFKGLLNKKKDFCSIIFADRRYTQEDKVKRLPEWIRKNVRHIPETNQVPKKVKEFMNQSHLLEAEGEIVRKLKTMQIEEKK